MAFLMAIDISANFSDDFQVAFGLYPSSWILAVAALAFARPRLSVSAMFQPQWRAALYFLLFLLPIFQVEKFRYDLGLLEEFKTDYLSFTNISWGLVGDSLAKIIILAVLVRWKSTSRMLGSTDTNSRWVTIIWSSVFLALIAVTLVFNFRMSFSADVVDGGIYLGISLNYRWIVPICFVFSVTRILDWRLQIGLIAGACIASTFVSPSNGIVVSIPAKLAFLHYASATLLGTILSPFWLDRIIAPLKSRRSMMLLGVVGVLQFMALGSGYELFFNYGVICAGVAYVAGLVWQVKGAIVAPLMIQLFFLLSSAAFSEHSNAITSELISLGAIAFPFTYFGLLSSRMGNHREPQAQILSAAQTTPSLT
jgi:hypothetical protein